MHLTRRISLAGNRRAAHRRPDRTPRSATVDAQARAKRSGGPEDVALYTCECGYVFKAAVTTSVGCPVCGAGQAW